MNISYDNYPYIGFPQSVLLDESGTFPFQLPKSNSKNQNFGFKRFVLNTFEKFSKGITPTVYYVSSPTWQKIETDSTFRESHIKEFLGNEIQTALGNLLLDERKMFIYLCLSKEDTLLHFNVAGNYIGVASLLGEYLERFEEVIVTEKGFMKGISFYTNNHYTDRISSYVMSCLSLSKNATHQVSTPRIFEKVVLIQFN